MKLTTQRMLGWQTSCLGAFVVILGFTLAPAIVSAQESKPADEAANSAKASVPADPPGPSVPAKLPQQRDANSIPDIVGTWSRAESGTFSKLTIWPVENREFLFCVEGADGNGLLEWTPAGFNFQGFFTFNLLGSRAAQVTLEKGPKETRHLRISPVADQRMQLLRSGFAKTERELAEKLSSNWTRVETPAQPMPMTTVAVVKTEFGPSRISELLRAKYRESPYRFISDVASLSVIVFAPAEAQEDIEVLIHQLDVKEPEKPNDQAASPNIAQAAPANPPQATSRRPNDAGATASSPEAKRLRENLQAQESAAAAEAATIRQLQANGQAEQNRQPIAEHQRKLKNLLSTAFDLKLQLEELQVKELQSRLSRLERQIGQRKELREKIIARRAGELIEGNALKWSPNAAPIERTKDPRDREEIVEGGHVRIPNVVPPATDEQRLRWRSGIVEIFAESSTATGTQQDLIGSGVLVSPDGLILSQVRPHRDGSKYLVRFDDGSVRSLKLVEESENGLHAFQSPAGTRVNHHFPLAAAQTAISDEVHVWGKNIGSPEHRLSVFKAQVAVKDRQVASLGLPVWQLSKPDHFGVAETWPVLNANGELLGITLRDTGDLLLVLPVEQIKKLFPKSITSVSNSTGETALTNEAALPSPDELKAQLEPFAKRVTAAADSVRSLEVTYLRDRSNTAELKLALKELTLARSEWRNRLKAIEPTFIQIRLNHDSAKLLEDSLGQRLEAVTKQLAEGKATEAERNAAVEAWKRAAESVVAAKSFAEKYETVFEAFRDVHGDEDDDLAYSGPNQSVRPQPGHDPDIALAWLEGATGLKLEFVRFDDLQLWFKAALRVRESSGERQAGDLIVSLNNQLFESLDQAVDALSKNRAVGFFYGDLILPGGLAGHRHTGQHFDGEQFSQYLRPGYPEKNTDGDGPTIKFEVRVRGEAANELVTQYLQGTCVSPEGLVVVPVSSKSLAADEPIVAYGRIKGTARVVATDDAHGLTLVKLESPDQPLFIWRKCRSGSPATGQRLTIFDAQAQHRDVSAVEVGQPLPKPLVGNDAFVFEASSSWIVPLGTAVRSVEWELQGITIAAEASQAKRDGPDKQPLNRHLVLPAVHIEKLVKDYRKTAARQAQTHAALEVPAANVAIGAEAAAKLIWDKIGMKFGEPVTAEKLGAATSKQYRGGLPIIEVRELSPDRQKGLRKGDILVGLDKWETTSLDNVIWILKQSATQPKSNQAGLSLKFFIIREGETTYGFLNLDAQIATTLKSEPPQLTAKSLDELLAVLQNDRDTNHVISALRQLGPMDPGDNAGRVATAILAAMEFHDPAVGPEKGQPPVSYWAVDVLRRVPRSVRLPVIVKTLKDGHPRAKSVATSSLNDEAPLWEYANEPDFSELAKRLFAMADGPDVEPRGSALNILAKTLPLSKIDLADLTTEERRDAVRRFAEAFPREKVMQLISDAVSDKDIRLVLTAVRLLRNMPEKLKELELSARLAETLTKIIEGKFHDVTATTSQRGEALSHLSLLRDRAATAVPVLIELLKSGNLDEGTETNNTRPLGDEFTRRQVIMQLGVIGPPAKDALPMLEAELELLDKKAKEEALLSGKPRSRAQESIGSTTASVLRMAIGMIKEDRPIGPFRPNF